MKAADIPDELFLAAVAHYNLGEAPPIPNVFLGGMIGARWALVGDLEETLGYPEKIIRAKARKLIKRGLLDGCACGCRGDFEIPGVKPYRMTARG